MAAEEIDLSEAEGAALDRAWELLEGESAATPAVRAGALVLLLEAKAGGNERANAAIEDLLKQPTNRPD